MPNHTTPEPGFVYMIRAHGTGLIKIGYTTNIQGRIAQLQTGSGGKLELLKSWSGNVADERAIHSHLTAYRREGEWFRLPLVVRCELFLVGDMKQKAIRLPDYDCIRQAAPLLQISLIAEQLASLLSGDDLETLALLIRAIVDQQRELRYAQMDLSRLARMIEVFHSMALPVNVSKKVSKMRDFMKCAIHWQSIFARYEAAGRPFLEGRLIGMEMLK